MPVAACGARCRTTGEPCRRAPTIGQNGQRRARCHLHGGASPERQSGEHVAKRAAAIRLWWANATPAQRADRVARWRASYWRNRFKRDTELLEISSAAHAPLPTGASVSPQGAVITDDPPVALGGWVNRRSRDARALGGRPAHGRAAAMTLAWDPSAYNAAEPWQPQPFDDAESYHAFVAYLELGPARCIARLARRWPFDRLAWWREWCCWVERAYAYDRHVERGRVERNALEPAERAVRDGLEVVEREMRKLLAAVRASPAPVLRVGELIRLVSVLVPLWVESQRFANGPAVSEPEIEAMLARLTPDELQVLREVQHKLLRES